MEDKVEQLRHASCAFMTLNGHFMHKGEKEISLPKHQQVVTISKQLNRRRQVGKQSVWQVLTRSDSFTHIPSTQIPALNE